MPYSTNRSSFIHYHVVLNILIYLLQITKMRFFILTLLVASAMAQQQNTQWTKEQYDQWQEAQARQGFGYVFF